MGRSKSKNSSNRKTATTATARTAAAATFNCKNSNNCNGNDKSSRNYRSNNNRRSNRKGKNHSMAIVHVAFKSSSQAPPAAAHAQYIAREGQYQQRGGVELVESGNMPEFAKADPHALLGGCGCL